MWGLHPGDEITPYATPKLARACRVSLDHRGLGDIGWSLVWQTNLWARLGDSQAAHDAVSRWMADNLNANLFDQCRSGRELPFQIDANFGATAGIAEMLLQSHERDEDGRIMIRLLPALPDAWAEGKVCGLRARGGFEIDITWAGGKVVEAKIHSRLGGACRVFFNGSHRDLDIEQGKVHVLDG
jgi:alpha-L-fucosidase 2